MKKLFFLCLLLLLTGGLVFAQKTVTGKVTDEKDGSPLTGVSVTVKGTNVGTATSADGTFRLSVPAGSKSLLITNLS